MPINVIDILKPANNGQFPAYEDTDGYGGFQVRANHSDITSIPMANRKIGMLAYSVSDGYFWQLNGTVDNGGWQQAKFNANSILGKSISSNAVQPGQTLTWSDDSGLWEPSFMIKMARRPTTLVVGGIAPPVC